MGRQLNSTLGLLLTLLIDSGSLQFGGQASPERRYRDLTCHAELDSASKSHNIAFLEYI